MQPWFAWNKNIFFLNFLILLLEFISFPLCSDAQDDDAGLLAALSHGTAAVRRQQQQQQQRLRQQPHDAIDHAQWNDRSVEQGVREIFSGSGLGLAGKCLSLISGMIRRPVEYPVGVRLQRFCCIGKPWLQRIVLREWCKF